MSQSVDVVWHEHQVTRADRERLNGHAGFVLWFTGLSGCGKSTLANLVDQRLHALGVHSFLLDGDNVRHGLNASPAMLQDQGADYAARFGLGFSAHDRQENIRRIGAVAELFATAGIVVLAAFVSPYRRDRDQVRRRLDAQRTGDFVEIFVDAPLAVCEQRDPKGLYQKARAGQIADFTGISAPYEPPLQPELHLDAGQQAPHRLADQVVDYLRRQGKLGGPSSADSSSADSSATGSPKC
jgi:adenylylsulfate kinase